MNQDVIELLECKVKEYNQPSFIENDPICIPHSFSKLQDIEISGFFAAILAWGNRNTIIKKCTELMHLMDNSPYQFALHHSDNDLKLLEKFKHRTFNSTDLLYFIEFFKEHYSNYNSLEFAFSKFLAPNSANVEDALIGFRKYFFSLNDFPERTKKHIATPLNGSCCKRLNMLLRWFVRNDACGVDFGIWKSIKTNQLIAPLDVHSERIARKYGLLVRKQTDWKAAVELTNNLKKIDPTDPVKFDFALFGIGVHEKL